MSRLDERDSAGPTDARAATAAPARRHDPAGTGPTGGRSASPREWVINRTPGLLVALGVAAVATLAGQEVPLVGGPVFGIVLGVLTVAVATRAVGADRFDRLRPGLSFASKPVLQTSIVLLGATLSLDQVAVVGLSSLPVMLGTLTVALLGAWLFGRLLGIRGDTQLLIGVGTAICGASAIAATQAVIRARESQVAYAVGTIFTFNIAAVLLFPQIGHLLQLDPHAFGLWAGTAINDTSSVVAAGYSYGADAGPYSVVVKLTRSLMLIPIVLGLSVWTARRAATATSTNPDPDAPGGSRLPSWTKVVPLFLLGFVAASALDTLGVIPTAWHPGLTAAGTFLITTALAGIGLALRPADLRRAGIRPLVLGAALWILVAVSSLVLQALTGTL